jgi:hypothetical protein
MSSSTTISHQSLRPDEQPLAQYHSVSRMAVVAAGLGLASAVTLASPLLAPLAVAAVITGGLALRAIAASGGQLAGRAIATFGICLASLFLGWGITRDFSRQATLESHARHLAETWLELIHVGKLKEALQFRRPPTSRLSSPEALAEYYEKDAQAVKDLQQFASQPMVKDLLAQGSRADIRYEGIVSATREGFNDRLILKYSYQKPAEQGERQPVWIHLSRRVDVSTKNPEWELLTGDTNPPLYTQ